MEEIINSVIIHDSENRKFILNLEEENAFVSYDLRDGVMFLNYSQVPFSARGKGIGKILVEKTFEYIEENNLNLNFVLDIY